MKSIKLTTCLLLLFLIAACQSQDEIPIELETQRLIVSSNDVPQVIESLQAKLGLSASSTGFSVNQDIQSELEIDWDKIYQQVEASGKKVYTFGITDNDNDPLTFYNLRMVFSESGEAYQPILITYTMEPDFYQEYLLSGSLKNFKGTISRILLEKSGHTTTGNSAMNGPNIASVVSPDGCPDTVPIDGSNQQNPNNGSGDNVADNGANQSPDDFLEITCQDYVTETDWYQDFGEGREYIYSTYAFTRECEYDFDSTSSDDANCGLEDGEYPIIVPDNALIEELLELLEENPELLLDIPCSEIEKWLAVARNVLPQSVQDKLDYLDNKYGGYGLLALSNANGYTANMDFFSVTVNQLPTGITAESLLNEVRTDLNAFVDTRYSSFSPSYEVNSGFNELGLWLSDDPKGAILSIKIAGDDGSVICSDYSNNHWRFSTIKSPWDYDHPVSGTREFGYTENSDGTWTFYTRGVDRFTQAVSGESIAWVVGLGDKFKYADKLWSSLQSGISSYVNEHGGQAVVNSPEVYRPSWGSVKEVVLGNRPISDLGCK